MRAIQAEKILKGTQIGNKEIEESARLASKEIAPISDVRAPARYRRDMTKVFVGRAIRQALDLAKV
jgi:carbon-monoxide dehydrogenase medium subunit